MEPANYSKPTQHDIDRAETSILIALSQLSGRKFAELAGWHESKVSRMKWRDIATAFCVLKMAAEISPLGNAIKEAALALTEANKKAPGATGAFEA